VGNVRCRTRGEGGRPHVGREKANEGGKAVGGGAPLFHEEKGLRPRKITQGEKVCYEVLLMGEIKGGKVWLQDRISEPGGRLTLELKHLRRRGAPIFSLARVHENLFGDQIRTL